MDIRLLEKFYRGACSEEEVKEVLRWFDAEGDKEKVLQQLQNYWLEFEDPEEALPQHRPEVLLGNIHARLRKEGEIGLKKSTPKSTPIDQFYRVAAIIVMAFSLSFLMQKIKSEDKESAIVSLIVKEVPRGQRQRVTLADGTMVTLNAESRLSYPAHFSENKREVTLEGEAFFEVVRDENRPFIIISGDIYTTVLGTSFNIKAYADDAQVTVSVASGQVKVSQRHLTDQAHYLFPNKEAIYQTDLKVFTLKDFEPKERMAWKDEILYFSDASFEEVKKALERWYDIEIQAAGKNPQEWQYSGTFQSQSLEDVLVSIGYVKHFTYEITGKLVTITFNHL